VANYHFYALLPMMHADTYASSVKVCIYQAVHCFTALIAILLSENITLSYPDIQLGQHFSAKGQV